MRKREFKRLLRSNNHGELSAGVDQLLDENYPFLATRVIQRLAAVESAEKLIDRSDDRTARSAVAKVLTELDPAIARPILERLATDDDFYTRAASISTSGASGSDIDRLAELLKDDRAGVAMRAADALPNIGNDAVPVLIDGLLEDARREVRFACAKALAAIGGQAAREALSEAVDRESYPWKWSFRGQLRRLE